MKKLLFTLSLLISISSYSQCVCDGGTFDGNPINGVADILACIFGGGSIDCTVPIELEEFSGYNEDTVNYIYWVTATEVNNEKFFLERSNNAKNWDTIHTVKGAGNIHTPSFYEYIDSNYKHNLNYYRLSQRDFNGEYEVFPIISIKVHKKPLKRLIRVVNLVGEDVDLDYEGIILKIYDDGSVEKSKKKE